jgi:hypothetical protein
MASGASFSDPFVLFVVNNATSRRVVKPVGALDLLAGAEQPL